MAPKKKRRTGHAETSDRPPTSDPNPTTTSPSTSVATGGTATASLLPSSALPSAPPTTTTQPVLSVPIPSPSSALAIATNQPPPPSPPLSIQEHISGTSVGTGTIADSAGPSTAPSASAASTRTPPVFVQDFLSRILPRFFSAMLETEEIRKIIPDVTHLKHLPMGLALQTLLEAAEKDMKAAPDFLAAMKDVKVGLEKLDTLLNEIMKQYTESRESCGRSKREGGGPDSGSGGGDGQGGGVCA